MGALDSFPSPDSGLPALFAPGVSIIMPPTLHAPLSSFAGIRLLLQGEIHLFLTVTQDDAHSKLEYLGTILPGMIMSPLADIVENKGLCLQVVAVPAKPSKCLELPFESFLHPQSPQQDHDALTADALDRWLLLFCSSLERRWRDTSASADIPTEKTFRHDTLQKDVYASLEHELQRIVRLINATIQESAQREYRNGLQDAEQSARHLALQGQEIAELAGAQKKKQFAAGSDPLLSALHALSREYRLTFDAASAEPADEELSISPPERLEKIALANHWRYRRVRLNTDFYQKTTESLIGFMGKDLTPVLLHPRGRDSCYLHPQSGREEALTAESARDVADFAYRFYESLPARILNWKDLALFGLLNTKPVLRVLLCVGLLGGAIGLAQPLAVEYVTGKIIPTANHTELWQLAILLVTLTLSGVVLGLTISTYMLGFNTRQSERCEAAVFDRLFRLQVNFFRGYTTGDLYTRVMAISKVQGAFFKLLTAHTMQLIMAAFSLFMLFYYSWRLTLVGIAAALFNGALLLLVLHRALPNLFTLAEARSRMAGMLKQFLDGVSKIRGAGAEKAIIARYLDDYVPAAKATFTVHANSSRLTMIGVLYPTCVSMLFFWLVGDVWSGTMPMAEYLAFVAAFGGFQSGVLSLCDGLWSIWKLRPDIMRVTPIIEAELEETAGKNPPGKLDGTVELSHISFRYAPDQPLVLDDVSLHAEPGEFIAVVGPSGSGKSTLVRLLLGFERPERGGVFYSGKELSGLDVKAVRRQLGVILQSSRVFPGSILSNILTGTRYTIKDAEAAVRTAALDKDVADMPMGLFTSVGEGLISGGQEQRVLIARAVVGNPSLLIMDESTSALDNVTQMTVQQNIEAIRATRIVIAHRLSTIAHADRIYVLEKGRVSAVGTFASLMKQDGVFKELATQQML